MGEVYKEKDLQKFCRSFSKSAAEGTRTPTTLVTRS